MRFPIQTLLTFLLTTSLNVRAQKFELSGLAFDSTHGRNWVKVSLNDTFNKTIFKPNVTLDEINRIAYDSNLVYLAREDGRFHLKVSFKDSLIFEAHRHIEKRLAVKDLLKMREIKILLDPEICTPYIPCTDTVHQHFAFIGQKIFVNRSPDVYLCGRDSKFDQEYDASYQIIEEFYGHFSSDSVKFKVYDHYGTPGFSRYSTVLLFVSRYCDKFIHQKYLYYPLYKNSSGV